jgi:hypothetical protein
VTNEVVAPAGRRESSGSSDQPDRHEAVTIRRSPMTPKLARPVAFGLTLAALAVPSTAAGQDLRSPDAREAAPVARAAHDLRSPDARSVVTPGVAYTGADLRSPDSRDAGEGRGTFSAPDVMVVKLDKPAPAAAPASDGLDWADAGIGAGALLALVALALGGAFVVTQRRGTATPV